MAMAAASAASSGRGMAERPSSTRTSSPTCSFFASAYPGTSGRRVAGTVRVARRGRGPLPALAAIFAVASPSALVLLRPLVRDIGVGLDILDVVHILEPVDQPQRLDAFLLAQLHLGLRH